MKETAPVDSASSKWTFIITLLVKSIHQWKWQKPGKSQEGLPQYKVKERSSLSMYSMVYAVKAFADVTLNNPVEASAVRKRANTL